MNSLSRIRGFLMKYVPTLYRIMSSVYNYKSFKKLPPKIDSFETYFEKMKSISGFLQIGANNGVNSDLINKYVNRYNWRGVLVEPVLYLFEDLKKNYSSCENLRFENVAVSSKRGVGTIYRLSKNAPGDSWIHGLASFDKEHVFHYYPNARTNESLIEEENIDVLHVHDLFEKYHDIQFNLICIDTEGHDEIILRSIDFSKYAPDYIIFEHKLLPIEKYVNLLEHLEKSGYRPVRTGMDTLLERKTI